MSAPPTPGATYSFVVMRTGACSKRLFVSTTCATTDPRLGPRALGAAHEAISGDMLHAQEKTFQRGVSHGKWLLKAQFDDAASLQMRVKHLEYVVAHYERWVRQLKTQLGEREPFSSNSNFPLDP